jgi:hypothetical protein
MSVLIPRIRTIGIRLSEQEYAALEKFCVENGARSISDFARKAIGSLVNQADHVSTINTDMDGLIPQVRNLEEKLEILTAKLALLRAGIEPKRTADSEPGRLDTDVTDQQQRPSATWRQPSLKEKIRIERSSSGNIRPAKRGAASRSRLRS